MLPPQIVPFLSTVALSVAGVLVLSCLFVVLSPWIQRHFAALLKELATRNHL